MNFSFFKTPKPRQFNYKPLYYDPDKEEAELRKKALNNLREGDPKERMRAEIRRKWRTDKSEPGSSTHKFKIIFYLIFAFFTLYLVFFTDFVNKLVSIFLR